MKVYSYYRAEARAALKGNWGVSALYYFVCMVVSIVVSILFSFVPFMGSLIASILLLPLTFGFYIGLLRQFRGKELQLDWLFGNYNGRIWCTMILQNIYVLLWTLLLIIPGIIKSYSYAMTNFILEDEPELRNNAAIERSMAMMQGRKWDLFVLDLTFLGWYLLGLLTLGIAWFWIYPYHITARVAFYEDLKEQE